MKRKVILFICILTIVASVTVLSNESVFKHVFEPATEEPSVIEEPTFEISISEEPFSSQEIEITQEDILLLPMAENSIDFLDEYLVSNEFSDSDRKRIENRFISTITEYRMTPDDCTFISSLITEDYDIEKVLDIYEFLQFTNSDTSMIIEIYLAGEQNSDEDFWIYDTYDRILGRTDDMLTVEDVAYYVANGLTVDEIIGAYELSFAGVKNTKQMLNERLDGSSWNTIVAPVISAKPEIIVNAPEMTINNIMEIRSYAVKSRQDFSDIIFINDGTITVKESVLSRLDTSREAKQLFIERYDAQLPVIETEDQIQNYTHTNSDAYVFSNPNEEYLFEEDYIPLEEPEVE